MSTKRETRKELQEKVARFERMYLRADAVATQADVVIQCAQDALNRGDDTMSSILFDAAGSVLRSYTQQQD